MPITATVTQFSGGVSEYNNDGLYGAGNYLLALCGRYAITAQGIWGNGGAIVPITSEYIISPVKIISSDFANATDWNGANIYNQPILPNYYLQVFWNDVNRFLDIGTEWVRTAQGFQIINNGTTITGFDATTSNYTFYIYISK